MPIVNGKEVSLLDYSAKFRAEQIARDEFTANNQYTETSPEALSPIGKGEKNHEVGDAADIAARKTQESKNFYSKNNQYDGSKVK